CSSPARRKRRPSPRPPPPPAKPRRTTQAQSHRRPPLRPIPTSTAPGLRQWLSAGSCVAGCRQRSEERRVGTERRTRRARKSRRRHTRFSRDWSSDVCSSDLLLVACAQEAPPVAAPAAPTGEAPADDAGTVAPPAAPAPDPDLDRARAAAMAFSGQLRGRLQAEIGRASCRDGEENAPGEEKQKTAYEIFT